jgi:hypothetical protein
MNSFLKGLTVGTASGFAATTGYLATQAARRRLDRGLARVEEVASEAQQALDSTRDTLRHTQQAVRGIRETIAPER